MVGRALSSDVSPLPLAHYTPASAAVSCGEFPGAKFDLHRFRAVFPDRWASLLKAHFRDTQHIQFFFGVSERTARDWLAGITAPAGPFVAIACATIPGATQALLVAA